MSPRLALLYPRAFGVAGLLLRMAVSFGNCLPLWLLRETDVVLHHLHAADGSRELRCAFRLLGALGEGLGLDRQFLRERALAQDLHAVAVAAQRTQDLWPGRPKKPE